MKTLVIYYSRSGHTERLAREIAARSDAELAEITADRYRPKFIGYMRGGSDSLRRRMPVVAYPKLDFAAFDAIAVGAPVWTSYLATPMRAFLNQHQNLPGRIGVFITSGSHSPPKAAFDMAENHLGRSPVATLAVANGKENDPETTKNIERFVSQLCRTEAAA